MYDDSVTGLEDFGVEDLKLPRLNIDHEKGGYCDSLAPEIAYPKIDVIPLGLVKQRVLWPAIMDDSTKKKPMCRSVDNSVGFPNTTSTDPLEAFPWQATGWNPNDFPKDTAGRTQLPCSTCRLATWGSHPDGKKTWCSQQHAIVLLYAPEGSEPSMLALFTAQRSSINVSKSFFGSIHRQQLPAFAIRGQWGLTAQMRGKNKYYVPTMVASGRTDQGLWPMYQQNYLQVRGYVTRAPRSDDDDKQQANVSGQNVASQNVNAGFGNNSWAPGQPTQQAATPVQPVQVAQPAVDPQRAAFEQWQRDQAAQAAAPAAQPVATPAPAQAVVGTVVEPAAMPFPSAASAPLTPVVGGARDDEALPF